MEPSLEVLLEKGLKGAKAQVVFECFPKSFDECDGAGFADGAETVLDTKVNEKLSEPRVGELGTLVGDKVPRRAEPTARRSKELLDISGGRLGGKDASREGHSREGVKNNGDLEMKETEQTGDVGQVSQPDVVGVASEYGPPCRWPNGWRQWLLWRRFLSNSADGFPGELPAGAGQGLGDELVAAQADERHGLNQLTDDIGVATDGRLGSYERADGLGVGLHPSLLVPASDGAGRYGEKPCGFRVGKDQQILEAEDSIALLRGVVRTAAFGKLLPPLGLNVSRLAIEPRVECVFLGPGKANLKRLSGVPKLGESETGGVTQKLGGFSQRAKRKEVKVAIFGDGEEDPLCMGGRTHGRLPSGWGRG